MAHEQMELLEPARHQHLRLARQVRDGKRAPSRSGFRRDVAYPDQPGHAASLQSDLSQLRAMYAKRVPVLGVDPDLVLVLETNSPPPESALRASNLHVLDWFEDRVVVAAPSDPELAAFTDRLAEYQKGPREDGATASQEEEAGDGPTDGAAAKERSAPHQAFLDCIDAIRPYSAREVVTEALREKIDAALEREAGPPLRVDIQAWCPEDEILARDWQNEVVEAVEGSSGRVLDRTLRLGAGLSLLRIEAPPGAFERLAELSQVRRMDVLPSPLVHFGELLAGSVALPTVLPPLDSAPGLAVIDSGIRSGHPLLGPAVADLLAVGALDETVDDNGHGTFVASLALYGSIEALAISGDATRPAARLISVRLLDGEAQVSDAALWEAQLFEAMELAVAAGARILNISVGDPRRPYQGRRPTPLAAALDEFARSNKVVVVLSAGNLPRSATAPGGDYVRAVLDDGMGGVLDPASSALALTVGALCSDDDQGLRTERRDIDHVPLGGQGRPSPLTRRGPGAVGMVKPEVSMPGGGAWHNPDDDRLHPHPADSVLGASHRADRLLSHDSGSSFAAPLVSYAAARTLGALPTLTPNGVRALVMASIRPTPDFLEGGKPAVRARQQRQVVGYGRPDADRAASSTDHRAVLIAEGSVPLDSVHLYRLPIPSSFFTSGGWRELQVGFAYDPPTRSTRLDYVGNRMHVHVYRGVTLQEVEEAFIRDSARDASASEESFQTSPDGDDSVEGADEDGLELQGPASISRSRVPLIPSDTVRGRGANQYAFRRFQHAFKPSGGEEFIVAIQNVQNWSDGASSQDYGLALALERDSAHSQVYNELRLFAETLVELDVEVEEQAQAETVEGEVEIETP